MKMWSHLTGNAGEARSATGFLRPRSRAAFLALALAGGLFPLLTSAAQATEPSHVQFTLEGCKGSAGVSFPLTGPFICPDDQYTTGNLGMGWNELDRVPFRVTTTLGNQADASTTYDFVIAADNIDGGTLGWDDISIPTVNTTLSDPGCLVSTPAGAPLTQTPGLGGADTTMYRVLTVTQPKGSTCVFDYNMRLGLGAAQFSGSSLHADLALLVDGSLTTQGIGMRDVSIPVKEILPQSSSITIEKVVRAYRAFTFRFTGQPNFKLGGGESKTFDGLTPGTYVVSEDAADGFVLESLICHDGQSGFTYAPENRQVTVRLAAGEHVTCTFTNAQGTGPVPPAPLVDNTQNSTQTGGQQFLASENNSNILGDNIQAPAQPAVADPAVDNSNMGITQLPRTGVNTGRLALSGLMMLIFGGLALLPSRRRLAEAGGNAK